MFFFLLLDLANAHPAGVTTPRLFARVSQEYTGSNKHVNCICMAPYICEALPLSFHLPIFVLCVLVKMDSLVCMFI